MVLYRIDRPQLNGVTFKLDTHAHFAAGVDSTHFQETTLHPSCQGRRTEAKKEVTCGSLQLKPITPLLKLGGLHALLLPVGVDHMEGCLPLFKGYPILVPKTRC